MPSAKWSDLPTMEGPTIYRIRVCGSLDHDWSERFWGMRVTGKHGKSESVLEGRLADQARIARCAECVVRTSPSGDIR